MRQIIERKTLTLILTLIVFFELNSQVKYCVGSKENFEAKMQIKEKSYLDSLELIWQKEPKQAHARAIELIPIVFHVIYDQNTGIISNQRILKSLADLNNALSNQGYYKSINGIDTEIRFCLAKQDPNGLLTSGITTTASSLTNLIYEREDPALKKLIRWNPYCYVNAYIVNEITSQSQGSGVAGYANLPGGHGSPTDGIVVEASTIGVTDALSVVLIHEVGHYLGLYHTFEGGCKNNDCKIDGDKICDTPPDNSIASSPCNDPANSCNTDALSGFTSDRKDLESNFLDYGEISCKNNFTSDQKDRMKFFLSTARQSLLNCKSCDDPCQSSFTTKIQYDSLRFALGNNYSVAAKSTNKNVSYEWYLNGVKSGVDSIYNPTFIKFGKNIILVKATGTDPQCISLDSICVEVYCPIYWTHNIKDTFCIAIPSTLNYSANISNGNARWYVNGILVSQNNNFALNINTAGSYILELEVNNANCSVKSSKYKINTACHEICDNEIDDDGDGLIDGFDTDCCDTLNTFYYDPCKDYCPTNLSNTYQNIRVKWKTSGIKWSDSNTPIVGDVDGDGDVEVLGYELLTDLVNYNTTNVYIINGNTGNLEQKLITNAAGPYTNALAIADADRNGKAEIYLNASTLMRYDVLSNNAHNLKWNNPTQIGYRQPSIADFDQDGIPELYYGTMFVNETDGSIMSFINPNADQGKIDFIAGNTGIVAVDILPDSYCAECDGLELISGRDIYSVNVNRSMNQVTLNREVQLNAQKDGYSSVADFDLDGDLDVMLAFAVLNPNFSSTTNIIVWEGESNTLLAPILQVPGRLTRFAHPALGDVDGDGRPEIIFTEYFKVYCYKLNNGVWQKLFEKVNNDNSGMSGCMVYDFDADGKLEIVNRDETDLYILNGATGQVVFTTPCKSGTGYDTPTVADIDGDGEAELLCSCGDDLVAFEPSPKSWSITRPVRNQLLYFNVNVNDDLTIPAVQQKHHIIQDKSQFNGYLNQYATKGFQAADIYGIIIDEKCNMDSVNISIKVCNNGPAEFNGELYISTYLSNPFTTIVNRSQLIYLGKIIIAKDSCVIIRISKANQSGTLYMVLNDYGTYPSPFVNLDKFLSTKIPECNFLNNLLSSNFYFKIKKPDLGPDKIICQHGVTELNAGPGFVKYKWYDGSNEMNTTVYGPGKYWVETIDSCGNISSDTLIITLDPKSIIELGKDINICLGDSINLKANGFNNIIWYNNDTVLCNSCPILNLKPNRSITVKATSIYSNGCISSDSIRINVSVPQNFYDTIRLCAFDSTLINGQWITKTSDFINKKSSNLNCDTIQYLHVAKETYSSPINKKVYNICVGDTISLDFTNWKNVIIQDQNNLLLCTNCQKIKIIPTQNTNYKISFGISSNCIYIDSFQVNISSNISKKDTFYYCKNSPFFYQGISIQNDTLIERLIQSTLSCDTLYSAFFIRDDSKIDLGQDLKICNGDSIKLSVNNYTNILWKSNVNALFCDTCSSLRFIPTKSGIIWIEAKSKNNCALNDTLEIIVLDTIVTNKSITICDGDSILINNAWIKNATKLRSILQSSNSCDSIHYLDIKVERLIRTLKPNYQVCAGDSIVFTPIQGYTYQWIPNQIIHCSNCPFIKIKPVNSTALKVIITSPSNCSNLDSTTIEVNPIYNTQDSLFICESNDSVWINNRWIKSEGIFVNKNVTSSGCDSISTIQVLYFDDYSLATDDTIFIKEGDLLTLQYQGDQAKINDIRWISLLSLNCNNCQNPILTGTTDGLIQLKITTVDGCTKSLLIIVKIIIAEDTHVWAPNIISPNGDQLNDHFTLVSDDPFAMVRTMRIYDRWGSLVYLTENTLLSNMKAWDGTHKNKTVNPGVYTYLAEIIMSNKKVLKLSGDITIVR